MQRQSIPGNDAGTMNGDGSRKALLHSTEGSSIAGAVGAFRANNSWPHKTVDLKRRVVAEHLPLDVAARALRNTPGGADQTNRDGDVLIQYELVGTATDPASIGSPEDLEWFGREVLGPDCRAMGVPLVSTVEWVAYPASFGPARQRLSPAVWDAYSGVLGHQHAPDNVHGDPGAIDIETILSAARGDDMPLTQNDQPTIAAGVEDAVKPGGRARDDFKTLFVGSLVHGLRKPLEGRKPEPGEGDLRPVFKELLTEWWGDQGAALTAELTETFETDAGPLVDALRGAIEQAGGVRAVLGIAASDPSVPPTG